MADEFAGHDDGATVMLLHALRTEKSVEAIAAETVRAIRTTVPGYDDISPESLERAVRNNIAMTTRVLRHARTPFAEDVPEAEALATERLEDAFSARAMQVYQDRAVADAVSDTAQRLQWTVDAVGRGLPPEQLRQGGAVYAVPADQPLRTFHATSSSDESPDQNELQRILGDRKITASAPHGGGLIGILGEGSTNVSAEDDRRQPRRGIEPRRTSADRSAAAQEAQPAEQDTDGQRLDHRIALGPPLPLERLPKSYAAAARIDEAAAAVGETGVVDLDRLSWRMAVSASPETTRLLQERWLTPLEREGAFAGQLIEALIAYLDHGLSIPRAAASIPVHANTLRYRLRRFADLTGADLEAADTIIELAWALAARRGRSSSL